MGNFDALKEPVSGEAPSGENLQHTRAFAELEKAAQGTPERQMGEVVVPGDPPDWRAVRAKALELLASSRDLRLGLHLVRSSLVLGGFESFADALGVLDTFVTDFWPTLHPELDAEEDNDPTARITAMRGLVLRDTLALVQRAPLVVSKAFGPTSLRDLEAGRAGAGEGTSIDAIFASIPAEALATAAETAERCFATMKALDEHWSAALPGSGPDFAPLVRLLLQARDAVRSRHQARVATVEAGGTEEAGSAAGGASADGPAGGRSGGAPGDIRSREDVVKTLERIAGYYSQYEPSSPVPLLLERCKRLVTMSFFEIVQDMLPDGVPTIETITGKRNEE